MSTKVAIIAPGEMGSFIGATLVAHGALVGTWSHGRSDASLARAVAAGFLLECDLDKLLEGAAYVLSIVPPDAALALAQQVTPSLKRARHKPIFVDCNAVSPQTVRQIAAIVADSECAFVDGGLFGGPTSGKPGAVLYVSGPAATQVRELGDFGLSVRQIDGEIGAASAMKLSFAAINKGFTAVAVMALMHAVENSCEAALIEQLAETQPGILQYISRFVPAMFPKSYRWAPEMEEVASFMMDDEEARRTFLAFAELYRHVAADTQPREHGMIPGLRGFCREASTVVAAIRKQGESA